MPIPKPSKGESKTDYISRCMGNKAMQEYDQKQRAAICHSTWDRRNSSVDANSRAMYVTAELQTAEIRTGKLLDQEQLIVPVVMLVEGVIHPSNAPSSELALAAEFGHFPGGWDGRPVVLDHPKNSDGEPIGANNPHVLTSQTFGKLFNTRLDGLKLKSEMWLDVGRASEMGGRVSDAVSRIQSGEIVEVSTGLFMDLEEKTGFYANQKYSGIWRNIVPDHLAVLSPGTLGACSIADGCGAPRANQGVRTMVDGLPSTDVAPKCNTGVGNCQMMGNAICDAPDCLMGTNDGLKYPDNNMYGSTDDRHEDVLMGMESNTLKTPTSNSTNVDSHVAGSLKAVAAAVGKALRSLSPGKNTTENSNCECKVKPGAFSRLASSQFGEVLGLRTSKGRGGLSDMDTREALQAGMRAKGMSAFLVSVSDDFFIFEDYSTGELYQMSYGITPTGAINFKDDAVSVRPVTNFVPVVTNQQPEKETDIMADKKKVDGLIANSGGKFVSNDVDWLMKMSDEQIDKFLGLSDQATKEAQDTARTAIETAVADAIRAQAEKAPKTVEEFIASAPAEVGSVLAEGVRMQAERKRSLVDALKANSRNKFSEAELNAMSIKVLENLASLSGGPDFSGMGGSANPSTAEALSASARQNIAPPMPEAFPKKPLVVYAGNTVGGDQTNSKTAA